MKRAAFHAPHDTTLWPHVIRYTHGRRARGEIRVNTMVRTRSILASFALFYGQRPLSQLGRSHVEAWMAERGPTLGAGSRRNEFQAVRQFTKWLKLEKLVRTDPCQAIKAPRVPRSVPRALTADEVERMRGDPAAAQRLRVTALRSGWVAAGRHAQSALP